MLKGFQLQLPHSTICTIFLVSFLLFLFINNNSVYTTVCRVVEDDDDDGDDAVVDTEAISKTSLISRSNANSIIRKHILQKQH
jgi:hypothetical protein